MYPPAAPGGLNIQPILFLVGFHRDHFHTFVVAAIHADAVRKLWLMASGAIAHSDCGHALMALMMLSLSSRSPILWYTHVAKSPFNGAIV